VDPRYADEKGEIALASSPNEIQKIGQDFRKASLLIPTLLCYDKWEPQSEKDLEGRVKELKRLLEVGRHLGAQWVRIFGGEKPEHISQENFIKMSAEAIKSALADKTEEVGIVLQNHRFAFNSVEAVQLAREVNDPHFGLVFSPDHIIMTEDGVMEDLLEAALPWTKIIYVADVKSREGGARSSRRWGGAPVSGDSLFSKVGVCRFFFI